MDTFKNLISDQLTERSGGLIPEGLLGSAQVDELLQGAGVDELATQATEMLGQAETMTVGDIGQVAQEQVQNGDLGGIIEQITGGKFDFLNRFR